MFYNRANLKKEALSDLNGKWKSAALVGLLFYIPCLVLMCLYFFAFFSSAFGILHMMLFVVLFYVSFSMLSLALFRWSNVLLKEGNADVKNFFRGITLKAIPSILWLLLRSFLWCLLLFVPIIPMAALVRLVEIPSVSVVAALVMYSCFLLFIFLYLVVLAKVTSYAMMFFALADKPDLHVRDSLNVAAMVTEGFRTNLFVTNLSFMGWALLCLITLGIACIWVLPYYSQVMTRAWLFMLKEKEDMLTGSAL